MIDNVNLATALPTDPAPCSDRFTSASTRIASSQFSILEAYELWAPTYDSAPNPLLALEARTLASLFPSLTGKYVLDIACGTGRWLDRLLALGVRGGVGVDFSPAMLAIAAAKPQLAERLVRADCRSLPFRSGFADLTVCSFALAHLPDVNGFADELARIARCGADLYVTDVHPEGYQAGWSSSFRHGKGVVEIPIYPRSVKQILSAFEAGGFEVVDCGEPHFEEVDRPVFVQAKKGDLFEEVRQIPAVLIVHFTRSEKRWRTR